MMSTFFSPRLIGEQRADFFDIKSLLKSKQFKGKKDEELVLALYDYFTSQVDGIYHGWDMLENKGDPTARGVVNDAVKLLNVYGHLICGQVANVLYRLFTEAGFKARQFSAPGHSLCEVFYADKWHFFDFDMWTWFRNKDGEIASVVELAKDARELVFINQNKSNPCNLPDRDIEGYSEMFDNVKLVGGEAHDIWPDHCTKGHTMDFYLRPGESIDRTGLEQGRHHLPERFLSLFEKHKNDRGELDKLHQQERYAPFRTYANGRLNYSPKLHCDYQDFDAGVWEQSDVELTSDGLVGKTDNNSFAIFRMQSPYVMCGKPSVENGRIISADGVSLSVCVEGTMEIFICDPENKWRQIGALKGSVSETFDVTDIFDGRYAGLIKFVLGEGAILKSFTFDAYLQMAAISLPRLVVGENKLSLESKDKYGLETVPCHMPIDFRDGKGLNGRIHSSLNCLVKEERSGWLGLFKEKEDQSFETSFRFDMPAGRKGAWFYVSATIKEVAVGEPARDALIYWSFDGDEWELLSERKISQSRIQWDCSLDGEVKMKEPTSTIYFKIECGINVCAFQCYSHLIEEHSSKTNLVVEHHWKEAGVNKSFIQKGALEEHSIHCNTEPLEYSYKMSHVSERKI